jgi:hypothetical protein
MMMTLMQKLCSLRRRRRNRRNRWPNIIPFPPIAKITQVLVYLTPVSSSSSKSPQVFPIAIIGSRSSLFPFQKAMRDVRQDGEYKRVSLL